MRIDDRLAAEMRRQMHSMREMSVGASPSWKVRMQLAEALEQRGFRRMVAQKIALMTKVKVSTGAYPDLLNEMIDTVAMLATQMREAIKKDFSAVDPDEMIVQMAAADLSITWEF